MLAPSDAENPDIGILGRSDVVQALQSLKPADGGLKAQLMRIG